MSRPPLTRRARLTAISFVLSSGLFAASLLSTVAHATESAADVAPALVADGDESTFPIDDANPTASLPAPDVRRAKPLEYGYLLLELTGRAESALGEQDFARAARYFEALTIAVPEAAISYRKLCVARSAMGDLDGAVAACRQATRSEGAQSGDLSRLLTTLLARPSELGPEDVAEIDAVLQHAEQQKVDPMDFVPQACALYVRVEDDARLVSCIERMQLLAPSDPRTASFVWALAMKRKDESGAQKALAAARTAGHDPVKLAEMQATMNAAFPADRSWIWMGLALALVASSTVLLLVRRGARAHPPWRVTPAGS